MAGRVEELTETFVGGCEVLNEKSLCAVRDLVAAWNNFVNSVEVVADLEDEKARVRLRYFGDYRILEDHDPGLLPEVARSILVPGAISDILQACGGELADILSVARQRPLTLQTVLRTGEAEQTATNEKGNM